MAQPWVWVAALTAAGFLLRRYHLGVESFWFDEADIVRRAQQPASTLLQGFAQAGENGPLYTLMLHYWVSAINALPLLERLLHLLFGPGYEAPIRGLSALFGTAAIPLMYGLARRVGGHWLGLVSAALLTFNPFHIWHSQDAKMYTLLVLMTLASALLYVDALRLNTIPLWAGYVLATWVMLTVHSLSGLVLLAQLTATPFLVAGGMSDSAGRSGVSANLTLGTRYSVLGTRLVRWGWAMLLILAPLFPIAWLRLAALLANTVDVGGWYSPTGLTDILKTIFVKFAVNQAAPPWEAIGGVTMGVLAFAGMVSFLRRRQDDEINSKLKTQNSKLLILALWLVPIILFWLITLRVPLFQPRYLIMALLPYLIMAAAGLLTLRRAHPLLMAGMAGILAVATIVALTGVNYSPKFQKEDWRGGMAYVQDHLRLRDVIVVFPGYLVTAVDTYYKPLGPGHVPQVNVKTIPSLRTKNFGERELNDALRDATNCHERAWLVVSPARQAQEDPDNKVQQWFQYNYQTFDTKEFNGVTVYGIAFNGQPNCWYPGPDHIEIHTFDNGLQFLGYIYELRDNATTQPDASYFPLTMYWRNDKKLPTDYIFRVQIKDPTGKTVVDEAQGPDNGFWPTSQWHAGSQMIDYRDLRLPGGLTPGDYTISLQVYAKDQPNQPLKTEEGKTEIALKTPLKVVPWKP